MLKKAAPLAVPALLVGLCIAAYFIGFIRPALQDQGRSSLMSSIDFHSYFLPRFELGSKELFAGRLPLWNRFEYGGIPLLATSQAAFFYVPKVLLYGLLPPISAHWVFLVIHHLALVAGFLLFLKDRDISGVSAFVGTSLFLFAIPILDSNYHPIRIANFVWMAPMYMLAERVARGSIAAFGGLALVVAIQITAGYPEFPMDIGALLAVHAVASHLTQKWSRPPWQTVPVLGAAFALGGLAAAAQLLPLSELGKVAAREVLAEAGRNFHITGGPRTPFLVVPGFIAFAVIGLLVPKGRLAAAGFVTCAIIFSGGWRLFKLVPGFGLIRFPLTWVFLTFFYVAWAGAAGCDAVVRRGVLSDRKRAVAAALVAVAGVAVAVAWAIEWRSLPAAPRPPDSIPVHMWSPNVGTPLAACLGIIGGIAIAATAVTSIRRETKALVWIPSLLVLVFAHLAGVPHGSTPAPFKRPHRDGFLARLHGDPAKIKGRVLSTDDILYGYEVTDRLPSMLGVELSFLPWRYRRIIHELGFITVYGVIDWEKLLRASGFLDAMDVEYVAAPRYFIPLFDASGFRIDRSGRHLALFRNEHRMGRAWINYAVRRLPSEDKALAYVLGPKFDPHREVVLEGPTRGTYPETPEHPAEPVEGTFFPDGASEFTVNLKRRGMLVVSESDYPGRVATVDGKPAEIHRADYVLYGVELPKGPHRIRFEYKPSSVRWGLAFSAIGLGAVAALIYFGRRRLFWTC
jgi:hypothetical protein